MFFYLTTLNLARFLNETAPQVEHPTEACLSSSKSILRQNKDDQEGEKGKLQYLATKSKNCKTEVPGDLHTTVSSQVLTTVVGGLILGQPVMCVLIRVCFTLLERFGEKLYMGNSATADIKGEGDVILKMTSKKELKLNNVLYVPEIRKNLVSGWLLNKFGFCLVFESDKFVLSKNQMYVGKGYAVNGMFKLNVMVVKNDINKMNSSAYLIESSNVWHGRLGHVNFNSMRRLIKFNSIPNFHIDSKYKCETYVEAKLTRSSFKSVKRKTKPLDMIHTDICDLKSLPTKGGNKYFITFIDDCTKYCYIYLLKSKDEAIDKFVFSNSKLRINLVGKSRLYKVIEEVNTCLHSPSYVRNMESDTSALFLTHLSKMETGSSSRLDDEVVQDKRQLGDNDLHDERQDQLKEEEVEPRRSKRARTEKSFGPDFVSFMVENEPTSYREAVTSSEGHQWKEAIKSEIDSILQNHTWELVDLPPGCKPLGYKWIFKKKMKADGTIDKSQCKMVIKGYRQREGLDYFDTYSPVTRITSIRMVLAIAALRNLEVHQMDVKTAFLNGDLEEEIYMNQPEGFIAPGQESKVCRLVKSLYGLKQAPKQWHQKFIHTMLESGFKINECDKCVYVKDTSSGYVILYLYVDDMPIIGSNDKMIKYTKDILKSKFDMKDMGLADVILGIKIIRTQNGLVLNRNYRMHYYRYHVVIEGYSEDKWLSDISQSAIGRAHSTMYNGKSRYICRRHNLIRQLLSTGVISIDYVKSKDNIADPLTKGLSRELVSKSSKGIGLKPLKE
ncbi:retrotransposon protein, putative, ty1-copia subclass [Tanacetum coccineum]